MAVDKLARLVESLGKENLERIIDSFCAHGDPRSIYIFGSYARGDYTSESDVDIYVTYDNLEHMDLLYKRMKSGSALGRSGFPLSFDLLVNNEEQFLLNSEYDYTIEHNVINEGIKIFEAR